MIKSKKLSQFYNIKHAFFNKFGKESKEIYKSLNCGIGSSDKNANITKNLNIISKKFSINKNKIVLLNQIHSNKFFLIDKKFNSIKTRHKGDALITHQRKIALGILTADCAPVFIYDKNKNIISAIHAGWKGAYKDIVKKVVKHILKFGSKPKDLIAVIGPCISIKNYEVKKNFKDKFLKKNKNNKVFFKIRKKKTYFSLNKYIYSELKKLEIKNIEIIKKDTFDHKNNFFSARRSIGRKENDYGRNISIIMIN